MSRRLENYEENIYKEIRRNYDKAVRSGVSANRAARNANYLRSTAKAVATRRMMANQKRIRKGKLPRTSWANIQMEIIAMQIAQKRLIIITELVERIIAEV